MGKTRPVKTRRRQRESQNNPTGRPTNEEIAKAKTEIGLLGKIDSPSEEERLWSIGSLSRLILEEPKTFQLVVEKSDVISKLVKRISDHEISIRIAACGVMRNLSAIGDLNVCEKILSLDCLSSLFAVVKNYENQTAVIKEEENATAKAEWNELLLNALATLVNISEFSVRAMSEILNAGILPLLFHFIRPNVTTINVSIYSVELLTLMSEDYPPCVDQITPDNTMLLKITLANQKNNILLRTFVAEILLNICPPNEKTTLVKLAIPTLTACLDYDPIKFYSHLASPESESVMKELVNGIMPKELEQQLIIWEIHVKAQINALQLLANILVEDEDESEMMHEQGDTAASLLDIIQLYNHANISNKIMPKCAFMDPVVSNFYQLKMIKNYLDQFWNLQSRALSCLNNIVLCFPLDALGDVGGLYTVIFDLCNQSFSSISNINSKNLGEIQNLLTTILYSILRKANTLVPSPWQIEFIFKLLSHNDQDIRTNGVGLLGCIAKTPVAPQIINDVGAALLKALEDSSGWVSTEALDVIFSVFDDHFDDVVVKFQMIEKLQQFDVYLRKLMKEGKGKMDELLYDRLDEARINIPQFIQYKKNQKK